MLIELVAGEQAIDPSEIASVESWDCWRSSGPSDGHVEFTGAKVTLKSGRKIYSRLTYQEVLQRTHVKGTPNA